MADLVDGVGPKVFVSYRSCDRPAVEEFSRRLRETGVDAWFDVWEIRAGDDIVARMDAGLDGCDAALIFVSSGWFDGEWARDEYTTLALRAVEDGIRIVPVMLEDGLERELPGRLRKRARRSANDFDAIRDALIGADRRPGLRVGGSRLPAKAVCVELTADGTGLVQCVLVVDGEQQAAVSGIRVDEGLSLARARHPGDLVDLGRAMARVVFAGEVGAGVRRVLDGAGVTSVVDLRVEADGGLLWLPYEAALLAGDMPVVLHPAVRVSRGARGRRDAFVVPGAGPLKVLVAVGAPDEGFTTSVPLDIEAEMGSILDAVTPAVRDERAQVRILEVASVEAIRDALLEDEYHVLHLSGHGGLGSIELENEDGQAIRVGADELVGALQASGRTVPLVFLSSCDSGGESTSLAIELHRQGVARVVAMQAPVSDGYATELAGAFYRQLSSAPFPRAGVALANARREVQQAPEREGRGVERAEWATATLLLAGDDAALIDSDLPLVSLRRAPVHAVTGPVPILDWGELVGRRRELRDTLRALRGDRRFTSEHGEVSGVTLTGIGGVGKSSLAGRAWARLTEGAWVCSATQGSWSLEAVCTALSLDLAESSVPWAMALQRQLDEVARDDRSRLVILQRALRQHPLLLVFDNFEDNLTRDGRAFLDEGRLAALEALADACRVGKLLITSRYPVPGLGGALHDVPIGPLSVAETRRLFLRLDGLKRLAGEDVRLVQSLIGGHPRVLEFLDALLRRGASVDRVRPKLRRLAREQGIEPAAGRDLHTAVSDAVRLGARDIFLTELLDALDEHEREVLLQVSVSSLPVALDDLAQALAGVGLTPDQITETARRLTDLSLLVDMAGELWVHRWTAEALKDHQTDEQYRERCRRSGELRMRRISSRQRHIAEGIEATENFIAAGALDEAADVAVDVANFLARQSTLWRLSFARDLRAALPTEHPAYKVFADHEAQALLMLGFTRSALERYIELVHEHRRLVAVEPRRSDYQRDLAVSLNKLAGAMRSLGQGQEARMLYSEGLEIARRLAEAEPENADYQRDLSVSYERLGDALREIGHGEQARALYSEGLDIARRLAEAEPDRAGYQRDLEVSLNKLGEALTAVGRSEQARELYSESLGIARRLADAEPDRADYRRDLSICYDNLARVLAAVGRGEQARELYSESLGIARWLADAEPDRADYQRDLSISLNNLAGVLAAVGRGEQARELYSESLGIARRLADAEPDRGDYQRDLSISLNRLAGALGAVGRGEQARALYSESLEIRRRLAEAEPDRADYQRDVAVALINVAGVLEDIGQNEQARVLYSESLEIRRRLAEAEPDRADYQRDLASSVMNVARVLEDIGQNEQARVLYSESLDMTRRLATAEPDRADYQRDLSVALNKLGDVLAALGTGERARELYGESLEIARRLVAGEPDRADYQRDLLISLNNLAGVLEAVGRGEQALELYSEGIQIARRLADGEPDRPDYQRDLSVSYERLGDALKEIGQGDRAQPWYREGLEIARQLAAAEPDRADYQRDLSISYDKLARVLEEIDQHDEAGALYSESLEIARHLAEAEPDRSDYQRDLLISYDNLARVLEAIGQSEQALELHSKSLEIRRGLDDGGARAG